MAQPDAQLALRQLGRDTADAILALLLAGSTTHYPDGSLVDRLDWTDGEMAEYDDRFVVWARHIATGRRLTLTLTLTHEGVIASFRQAIAAGDLVHSDAVISLATMCQEAAERVGPDDIKFHL